MLTLRWILTSYGLASLALVGMLWVVALCAALLGSSPWIVPLLFVPAVPGFIVGLTYRNGMTKGASARRPVLLALVVSGLILGALSSYLGYATLSWVLNRGQPEANIPGLWPYVLDPSQIRSLSLVRGDRIVIPIPIGVACFLGTLLAMVCTAAGLRKPNASSTETGPHGPDPAAFLDRTVVDTDSKLGQRIAGLLLMLIAGGGIFLLWRVPSREHMAVPAIFVPVVLFFGLGLLAAPFDAHRFDTRPGGGFHFPIAWIILPIVGLASGFFHWWLLSQ